MPQPKSSARRRVEPASRPQERGEQAGRQARRRRASRPPRAPRASRPPSARRPRRRRPSARHAQARGQAEPREKAAAQRAEDAVAREPHRAARRAAQGRRRSPPTASRRRSTTPSSAGGSRARTPPSSSQSLLSTGPRAGRRLPRRPRAAARPRAARAPRSPATACCARSTAPAARWASARRSRSRCYDDLTRGAGREPPERPHARASCARCATTRGATTTASRCWARSSASSAELPRWGQWTPPTAQTRAAARRRARAARSTTSPSAATASRAATATSCSSRGAVPGDRVRAVVTKRKRAYAEARTRRDARARRPTASRRSPTTRARRGRCCPTSASSRSRPSRSTTRCGGSASSTASSCEPIVPAVEQWRYRNKLEYSFGTGDGRRARVRLPRARLAGSEIVARRGLPAGLRARQRGARRGARRGAAREGLQRLRPPHAARACCATSSCARAGAPASCRCASSPRARRARRRRRSPTAVDADEPAVDARPRASARPPPAARPSCSPATDGDRGGARRPALPHLARGVLPDQHRDGRARSTALAAEYAGAAGLGARLRPLLRHRHDRPVAGRRAPARCGAWRSSRRRSPTRSPTRAATRSTTRASSPATCASRCASSSSRPAGPTSLVVDPPRAGLSQKVVRRIIEAAPKRIVYVSCNPTTLAPNAAQLVEAGYALRTRAPGRHVPADAAHRVRGAARARLSLHANDARSWSSGRCKTSNIAVQYRHARTDTFTPGCRPSSAAALSVLPATAGADGFPLVGWWPMNEGSGQVVHDYSGHGNNGTLGDSPGVDDHDPAWIRGRLRRLGAAASAATTTSRSRIRPASSRPS